MPSIRSYMLEARFGHFWDFWDFWDLGFLKEWGSIYTAGVG